MSKNSFDHLEAIIKAGERWAAALDAIRSRHATTAQIERLTKAEEHWDKVVAEARLHHTAMETAHAD